MTYEVTKEETLRALATVRDQLRDGTITDRMFDMEHEIIQRGGCCETAGCIGGHAARVLVPNSWEDFEPPGTPDVWTIMRAMRAAYPGCYPLFYEFASSDKEHVARTRAEAADAIDRCLAGDVDPWRTNYHVEFL